MRPREVTILLVDDNEAVLHTRTLVLQRMGYVVVPANNAANALRALTEHTIDAAIVDFYLPDCNGDELCRKIKSEKPAAVVIIFSGILPDEVLDCADYFVLKGESPELLTKKLDELLARGEDTAGCAS